MEVKRNGRTDWVPEYLQDETKELLRAEMRRKRSDSDVFGYIYAFEIDGERIHAIHGDSSLTRSRLIELGYDSPQGRPGR